MSRNGWQIDPMGYKVSTMQDIPKVVDTPEFLGAVMSKVADVNLELMTAEDYPHIAGIVYEGFTNCLTKEAGWTAEEVDGLTTGLALLAYGTLRLDDNMDKTAAIGDIMNNIQGTVNTGLDKAKGAIEGAAIGWKHPGVAHSAVDLGQQFAGLGDYLKPVSDWSKQHGVTDWVKDNKSQLIGGAVGALGGLGANALTGGGHAASSAALGAGLGYATPYLYKGFQDWAAQQTPTAAPAAQPPTAPVVQ